MQRSPAASTCLLVFSEAVKIYYITINEVAACDASLQVLCNAACVKMQHCLLSSSCVKLLSIKVHKKMILNNYVCDAM